VRIEEDSEVVVEVVRKRGRRRNTIGPEEQSIKCYSAEDACEEPSAGCV
jgi:hypothetical protein